MGLESHECDQLWVLCLESAFLFVYVLPAPGGEVVSGLDAACMKTVFSMSYSFEVNSII